MKTLLAFSLFALSLPVMASVQDFISAKIEYIGVDCKVTGLNYNDKLYIRVSKSGDSMTVSGVVEELSAKEIVIKSKEVVLSNENTVMGGTTEIGRIIKNEDDTFNVFVARKNFAPHLPEEIRSLGCQGLKSQRVPSFRGPRPLPD